MSKAIDNLIDVMCESVENDPQSLKDALAEDGYSYDDLAKQGEKMAKAFAKFSEHETIRTKHKNVLIATVGLPRSGKTTWAKSQAYPIVNPDSIRLAIHGKRYIDLAEQFVWATAKAMVRALFLAGHQFVILDATNNTKKRRDDWQSNEWATYFKVFNTPASVCIERANAENDTEIIPIIERMSGKFENLDGYEMLWP